MSLPLNQVELPKGTESNVPQDRSAGESILNRRLSLILFLVGLILFVTSGIVHFSGSTGYNGDLSDLLVYPGGSLLILAGFVFVYRRHKQGRHLTAQPQLSVIFLTGWWFVFFISGFLIEIQVGGALALDVYEADFFMILFLPAIFLFQTLQQRRRNRRSSTVPGLAPGPGESGPPVPLVERPFTIRERAKIFLFFLAAFVLAAAVGAALPMDGGTAQTTYQAALRQIGTPSAFSIWRNNFLIAAIGFVPGYGINFELFTSFNTGQAFDAIGVVSQRGPGIVLLLETMLTPYFWLEFVSYSVAPTAALLTLKAHARGVFRRELLLTVFTFAAVAVVLYTSAVIEMAYILGK